MESLPLKELQAAFLDVAKLLGDANEPSLVFALDDVARKTLLVSAASYFEVQLSRAVEDFCRTSSGANSLVPSLVTAKAVKRQYHTWFSWDGSNANAFFAMFGSDFKAHMQDVLKDSPDLEDQISAFMELGRERNRLVHGDYATYPVEKTAQEIYATYLIALEFVRRVPIELRACAAALIAKAVAAEGRPAGPPGAE
jgi:hypothetical protein